MFCHSARLQSHPTRLKQFSLTVPSRSIGSETACRYQGAITTFPTCAESIAAKLASLRLGYFVSLVCIKRSSGCLQELAQRDVFLLEEPLRRQFAIANHLDNGHNRPCGSPGNGRAHFSSYFNRAIAANKLLASQLTVDLPFGSGVDINDIVITCGLALTRISPASLRRSHISNSWKKKFICAT